MHKWLQGCIAEFLLDKSALRWEEVEEQACRCKISRIESNKQSNPAFSMRQGLYIYGW